jgi:hypothetical protein
MADKSLIEQMLERLVNEDQAKAEELFHEYVVSKSREIYQDLIESELAEEEEDEDEDMEEAASDEDAEEDKVDESADEESDDEEVDEEFEDIAIEGDDEMDAMGGDPTDDLEGELDGEDEEGEKSEEELFQDLDSIVDELQAKFDELKGGAGDEMGGEEGEEEMKDDFELDTVREYVEKVAPAKMGDNGANTKSIVAGKNDMGGTTANIAKGGESKGEGTKGGLLNPSTKEDNAGNINVPGGKAGSAFSKKEPGHGAEKKGAAEQAENKQSLFRGRR